jgi:hypothetical protein
MKLAGAAVSARTFNCIVDMIHAALRKLKENPTRKRFS